MATPDNLTASEIETIVMNQLRLSTANTTELTKVRALINLVYRDIYVKYDWWFLVKRTVINTDDDYGSVEATVGTTATGVTSTSVTLTSAPSTGYGSFAGRMFLVTGNADSGAVYRAASHTAGATALVLDAGYTGDYSTSASIKLYQDTYDLPADCGKVLIVKRYGRDWELNAIGPSEMARLKMTDATTGKPEAWTVMDFDTTGDPTTQRQLIVHPYPDDFYRLELIYKQQLNTELSSTTQPFLPDEYRQLLVYGALARGYPVFLGDPMRGQYFQQLFNDLMNLMVAAHREYASDKPAVVPREGYRRQAPPRGKGRVSMGAYFDTHPVDW